MYPTGSSNFRELLWWRLIGAMVWHGVVVTLLVGLLKASMWALGLGGTLFSVGSWSSWLAAVTFGAAQLLALSGYYVLADVHVIPALSPMKYARWLLSLAWRALSPPSTAKALEVVDVQGSLTLPAALTSGAFLLACTASGFLCFPAFVTLSMPSSTAASGHPVLLPGVLGALMGGVYAARGISSRKFRVLTFPVLSQHRYFRLKQRVPRSLWRAARLASACFLAALLASIQLLGAPVPSLSQLLQLLVTAVATLFAWDMARHVVEIVHTEMFGLSPKSRLEAEVLNIDPNALSLMALSEPSALTPTKAGAVTTAVPPRTAAYCPLLLQYQARLDLCTAAEQREAAKWRREAIFEGTGRAWSVVEGACLDPLRCLTQHFARGAKGAAATSSAAARQGGAPTSGGGGGATLGAADARKLLRSRFPDQQEVLWCIRTLSALVAASRTEDRFGVVQASYSVERALTTFASCLLACEDVQYASVVAGLPKPLLPGWQADQASAQGPNGQAGRPSKEMTALARVAADALRCALHLVLAAFVDEFVSLSWKFGEYDYAAPEVVSRKLQDILPEVLGK
eukprot:jgi/Mesvir1/19117/Mv12860-RA.1